MSSSRLALTVCFTVTCLMLSSCANDSASSKTGRSATAPQPVARFDPLAFDQKALDAQIKAGLLTQVSLFDGQTLDGWTTPDGKPVEKGWIVEDGTLYRGEGGGSLHSAKSYTDFIFDIEWKVAAKSNSGIKYRYTRSGDRWNGPEYQILDDIAHPDAKLGDGKRRTACLYDILSADTAGIYKLPGEWNHTRIVAAGPVVQHWLNGKMVLQYNIDTPEFKAAIQKSKFKAHPGFAARQPGVIHIQDHGDPVWYRAIRMIELPGE